MSAENNDTTNNYLNLSAIFSEKAPHIFPKSPGFLRRTLMRFFSHFMREKDINQFLQDHQDKKDLELVGEFFDYMNFSYTMSSSDKENIPAEGKLLVIANHPLGALDGLALLKAIHEVRGDVKIVVNDILGKVPNLQGVMLPNDSSFNDKMEDADVAAISTALRNEEAVIIFPSSEVSKLYTGGIKTGKWRREVIRFAQQTEAPILPVYLKARNSFMFYLLSWISNGIATLMLPRESLNKRGKTVKIRIGDPIPFRNFNALEPKEALNLLKKHLKAVSHNRKGPYMTEKNVIHPVDRRELRDEILSGELLGETDDGKLIYFLSYQDYPLTMREISRLREVTFRKMGEGTGKKQDMDIYDTYYRHLVLWDDTELEVVGAYRFGIGREILQSHGLRGFYVDSLFELQPKYEDYLPITVELGRSFVQQRYWNSQALDYLWHGIGAYVAKYPDTKYLVGPVTISPSYSKEAKEMLVFFYSKWFPGSTDLAIPRTPFILSEKAKKDLAGIFTGETYKEDFKTLKKNLKHYGFSVPTLYKQYTELCEEGGVTFLGYNIDESFGNCVDGFITVNLDMLVPRKWQRYIESKKEKEVAQA